MTKTVALHELNKMSAAEQQELLRRTEDDLSFFTARVDPIIEAVRRDGDAALARGDVLPEVIDALAKRGDDTDAGDDDALSLRCVRHKAKQAAWPSAAELPGKSNSP